MSDIACSVIMVTNREGSVEYLKDQLDKQTMQDFEVVIADDADQERLYDKQFKPRQPRDRDAWNLNKAYNDCLQRVDGELIVFVQDFIWLPANGIERFWEVYQLYPHDLITGVGHKYKDLEDIAEVDDRVFGDRRVVESDWTYYELNWASCPTDVASSFEEDCDTYYGGENQIFALKAHLKGADIYIDRLNECKGLSQEECGGRPDDWEENHSNKHNRLNRKIQELVKAQ